MPRLLRPVLATVAALVTATFGLVSAASSPAQVPPPQAARSYHMNVVYTSGRTQLWHTTSQSAWLYAARNVDADGVAQKFELSSMWLTDDFTHARVVVHFCAKPRKQCGANAAKEADGTDPDRSWYPRAQVHGLDWVGSMTTEGRALTYFMHWTGEAYLSHICQAAIKSPQGNIVVEKAPHAHNC